MSWTRKSRPAQHKTFGERHRFQHWYRDNQIYFITARCRNRVPAFRSEVAKHIFWDRFDFYTEECGYVPWITSLIANHYHTLGYLKRGEDLPEMMRKLHGSIAKLVNDILDVRLLPFWRDCRDQSYFDGCIRDELQCRRAYRYTLMQCVRHRICDDPAQYPHTRMRIDVNTGVKRAHELGAFLKHVPYKRYRHPPS